MKIAAALVSAATAMVLAVYFGWRRYEAYPRGDLFYTPMGPCPNYSHSFTTAFVLTLLAAIVGFLLTAIVTSLKYRWSTRKNAALLATAKTSALVAIITFLLCFTAPLFELALPLQKDPGCTAPGW
jgi:hypothetical protein